jgi:hypothetical protein
VTNTNATPRRRGSQCRARRARRPARACSCERAPGANCCARASAAQLRGLKTSKVSHLRCPPRPHGRRPALARRVLVAGAAGRRRATAALPPLPPRAQPRGPGCSATCRRSRKHVEPPLTSLAPAAVPRVGRVPLCLAGRPRTAATRPPAALGPPLLQRRPARSARAPAPAPCVVECLSRPPCPPSIAPGHPRPLDPPTPRIAAHPRTQSPAPPPSPAMM